MEDEIWQYTRNAVAWTNSSLQPPPPHVVDLFVAAAENKDVADAMVDSFGDPRIAWAAFATPEGTEAFVQQHGRRIPATTAPAALALVD